MKATRRPGAVLKSSDETSRPSRSGSRNAGNVVPSGSIVEGVKAMGKAYPTARRKPGPTCERVRIAAVAGSFRLAGVALTALLVGASARSAGTQTAADDFFD